MKAYSPTTCLAAGAERGVCILWNITGDCARARVRRERERERERER